MLIAGVLMSLGAFSFANWRTTSQQQGTADRLVSDLRKASVLSVSEGRTHCVELRAATRDLQLYRYSCGGAGSTALGGRVGAQGSHPTFDLSGVPAAGASTPCPSGSKCLYFTPRGTATPATVIVGSSRRSKIYSIRVEGLTARVYQQ